MKKTASWHTGFEAFLKDLGERGQKDFSAVDAQVGLIIEEVRKRGDKALIELSARFDGARLTNKTLRVSPAEVRAALRKVAAGTVSLLQEAAARIWKFHREQVRRSWTITDDEGTLLGQNISPVESAGLYVPGGKAAYPSSVLMNAIPAQVAGVKRLVICTPAPGGSVNPLVLAAAELLGIGEVYKVGGAQAVAAMAYGTRTIRPVDKIVGPGNIYVAAAKKAVFGKVSIDMIAGPSEVFIIADRTADPDYVAADLLSQAEHDQMASCVLLTDSKRLAGKMEKKLAVQLAALPRRRIAEAALRDRGAIIIVRSITEAFDLANRLGPEHLEVLVENPLEWLTRAKYAGSVFFGPWTPEPLGDYLAGPNHVLPTGGAARFSSSLGVDDFLVRSNVLCFKPGGFFRLAPKVSRFAELEGLDAHARSVKIRKRP